MKFEWSRIHKTEERYIQDITDAVYDYVIEYFDVESICDLTREDIDEIEKFREEIGEYNIMQVGFSNLISWWESESEDI